MNSAKSLSVQGHLGQQGVNLVERIVLQMGSRWTPGGPNEVGIDGYIELFDPSSHKPIGKNIALQSKAVSSFYRETKSSFEFWCDRRDLEYWLSLNIPVILVISRPATDEAYWISINEYFKNYTRKTSPRINISKIDNAFTPKSYRSICCLHSTLSVTSFIQDTAVKSEKLISNLIPITSFPKHIYHAFTEFRRPNELWVAIRKCSEQVDGAWVLRDKGILSFRDLSEAPWTEVCEVGTVEPFDTDEWAFSNDLDRRKQFVQLLNCTLRTQLTPEVKYWPREDRYAFSGDLQTGNIKRSYKSAKKSSSITVVSKFSINTKSGREFSYLRHLAFHGRFICLDDIWYLEITPTYRFTKDGFWLYTYHEDMLKGIKRIEGNRAVLSAVLYWSDYLRHKDSMFDTRLRYLEFGSPSMFNVTKGLTDANWGTPKEQEQDQGLQDEEILQLSLFDGE